MGRVAIVFVACMVLLAGCSTGGGGTASPEATTSPGEDAGDGTPDDSGMENESDLNQPEMNESDLNQSDMNESDSDMNDSDSELDQEAQEAFENFASDDSSGSATSFDGKAKFTMRFQNGSQETYLRINNDTENQLYVLNDSTRSGYTTYYISPEGNAVWNTTTGEKRYGTGDKGIETQASFTAFAVFAGFLYISIMDWEPSGTTSFDGETAYVLEADSLNQSAMQSSGDDGFNLDVDGQVGSATGRMVITQGGNIASADVDLTAGGQTSGVEINTETGDSITVDKPSWVEDSKFGN